MAIEAVSLHGKRLAERLRDLRPSVIRRMLAVSTRPGMISFAGGGVLLRTRAGLGIAGMGKPAGFQMSST
ncbi:hypothetical protein GCM10009559_60780 [Pseudonocardia zijingensis]|uniref:Uncharacterized protein n=1 Tax=Pseudonocardia zijingensis TaxID=153376 RepID=A0ABN1N9B4_9PSEU